MRIDLGKISVTYAGEWSPKRSYEHLTLVKHNEDVYISLSDNTNVEPGTDESVWDKAVRHGQSIYELAVEHGNFTGTEQDFVDAYDRILQRASDAADSVQRHIAAAEADHTRAEADHSTALADHQQAGSDHSQAAQDSAACNRAAALANSASAQATAAAQSANNAASSATQAAEAARINNAKFSVEGETLNIKTLNS